MPERLLIVGNSSIDNIVMSDGLFHQNACGGNCFHASMAAGILVDNVAVLANVPSNFPISYKAKLDSHGIDTSLLRFTDRKVDWSELFIYKEAGDRDDGMFISVLEDIDGTYLTDRKIEQLKNSCRPDIYSYRNFREEFPPDIAVIPADWNIVSLHLAPTALAVHKRALLMDVPIKTLDPGRYLVGMPYSEVQELVSLATVFAPSRKEMRFIFPELDLVDAVARIGLDCDVDVVCKNGGDGCIVYLKTTRQCFRVGTFPSHVVDYTGAGDSFCGALNAALSIGGSLLDAVRQATVVAAKAIETVSSVERNKIDKSFVYSHYSEVDFEEVRYHG